MSESTNAILKRMSGESSGPLVIPMSAEYKDSSGVAMLILKVHISEEAFLSAVRNQVPFVLCEHHSDDTVTNYYASRAWIARMAPDSPLGVRIVMPDRRSAAALFLEHTFMYSDDDDAWVFEMSATRS